LKGVRKRENKKKGDNSKVGKLSPLRGSVKSLRINKCIAIIAIFVKGVKRLRIENKKRASELENSLALQSLRYSMTVISIISMLLGFDKSFSLRGANETEPRTYQLS